MRNQELLESIEELPEVLSEDWIEQAIQKLAKSRMSAEQRMHYEIMLAKNVSILEMEKAEQAAVVSEALRKKDIETAKKLLKKGMEMNEVSDVTGLSIDEILAIEE